MRIRNIKRTRRKKQEDEWENEGLRRMNKRVSND